MCDSRVEQRGLVPRARLVAEDEPWVEAGQGRGAQPRPHALTVRGGELEGLRGEGVAAQVEVEELCQLLQAKRKLDQLVLSQAELCQLCELMQPVRSHPHAPARGSLLGDQLAQPVVAQAERLELREGAQGRGEVIERVVGKIELSERGQPLPVE